MMKKRLIYEYFTKFCTCAVVTACLMLTSAYAATLVPLDGSAEEGSDENVTSEEKQSVSVPASSVPEPSVTGEEINVTEGSEEPEEPVYSNAIPAVNLAQYTLGNVPEIKVIDQTGYAPDVSDYVGAELKTGQVVSDKPTVLIYHTHGTERYAAYGTYPDGYEFNSENTDENVVAVGDALAEYLEELGIHVIHDRTMYDADGYTTAYARSKKSAKELLAAYPTVEYAIDLHRDSVESGGRQAKTVTLFDDECAQVMIVVGTDAGGSSHKNWKDNFAVAVRLQQTMNELYPTFARPIYLRTASFNQELCPGALLIEVGACGNTVGEAKNAAKLLAGCIEKSFR